MIVTKHCKPADRERMLNGHFKIGSHNEYSGGEASGLLSDQSEGRGATQFTGKNVKFNARVGGLIIQDFVAVDCDTALHVEEKINTPIFCTSEGAYDSLRHNLIQHGSASEGYPSNPDTSAYLTLEAEKLRDALQLATDEAFGVSTSWIFKRVLYRKRIRSISVKNSLQMTWSQRERLVEQAFTKPLTYKCEEEFRFVMMPIAGLAIPLYLFTKSMSGSVQEAFRIAIVDHGKAL